MTAHQKLAKVKAKTITSDSLLDGIVVLPGHILQTSLESFRDSTSRAVALFSRLFPREFICQSYRNSRSRGKIIINEYPAHREAIMSANGDKFGNDIESDSDSGNESPAVDTHDQSDHEVPEKALKPALKKAPAPAPPPVQRPPLPPQTDPKDLDVSSLTPLTPEIIARQATINIGTIGHVAHGKSTVVKAISGVQTVRFKNELIRNITIKLGYANAKIYQCDNKECPRPGCYRSYKSDKEVDPPCEREGCGGTYRLLRHVS
jgi:hypothetical protein